MDEKIIIFRDGNNVISRYYKDNISKKQAYATCSPDDEFDFLTGAKLAFERLTKEDKPEPKPKEIQLYCVKDYKSGTLFTKGKIYKFANGQITYDDGLKGAKYNSWEEYKQCVGNIADCLVPLVKRPAKKGEWIYISKNDVVPKFEGTIGKVEGFRNGRPNIRHKTVWFDTHGDGTENTTINDSEYLVLDGYKPEPEKPKLYNSKLVCVKGGNLHTKGMVYKVVDGVLSDDTLTRFGGGFKSLDDVNRRLAAQFIELVE